LKVTTGNSLAYYNASFVIANAAQSWHLISGPGTDAMTLKIFSTYATRSRNLKKYPIKIIT
jgi:hypothetical protein